MKLRALKSITSSKSSPPPLSGGKLVENSRISIALDWFQIHCINTPHDYPATVGQFEVKNLGRKGQFNRIYEIFYRAERIATLAANPDTGFLKHDSSFLKVENKFLYTENLSDRVKELIHELGLMFKNVSRVDIACDFHTFKNNLHPETFIDRFVPQKPSYTKLRKTKWTLIAEHGKENEYTYLRFGSPKSNLTYYIYNKTKELDQVKNKPWIREKWQRDELNENTDVWRLEFRIHSCSKGLVDPDAATELKAYRKAKEMLKRGGSPEAIQAAKDTVEFWNDNKADAMADAKYFSTLDVLDNYQEIYKGLFHHYFDFRYNDGQKKKCRMKRIPLLDLEKPEKIIMQLVEKMESNRVDKMLLKKLMQLNNELREGFSKSNPFEGRNAEREKLFNHVINYYGNSRDLSDWLRLKFPELLQPPTT